MWSGWPLKYPNLKVAMSEGGLGWVAMLLDRFDFMAERGSTCRTDTDRTHARATSCSRNFWFCTIDDPSTIDTRYRIGVENVMIEVDYPHGDSTWPDTQGVIERSGVTSPTTSFV